MYRYSVPDVCSVNNSHMHTCTHARMHARTHAHTHIHTHTHTHTQTPVWLSLVSHADSRRAMCMQFLEELASAIVELDTKETKL